MNFQQLRLTREAARRKLNLTEVANVLYTSQSGVSKHIKDLEDELGVEIFVRRGKRLVDITEPGRHVLTLIERILLDVENLRRTARHFAAADSGSLVVATTHTQARYVLPKIIPGFRALFPNVHLALHQGSPAQITEMVAQGEADVGIATESLDRHPGLVAFPYYTWRHVVVAPRNHALAQRSDLTLADIAQYPIITYDQGFTGRPHIDAAFAQAGLAPDMTFTAIDADVIKTYVGLDMGIGIVSEMAFDAARDTELVRLDIGQPFAESTSRIGVRRGVYLRSYVYRFIEMLAPQLNADVVRQRLAGDDAGVATTRERDAALEPASRA
ncbi:CysB family HTH-type transcriptional regulator [Chitinasiproducens palmae]|uniref:Transcriptional regulator, LysR family n=1 Tax=Chitinasiproducens palmae TaxID=1770053 RepID=A0A1H2PKV6_9BURK|nr:CysB family HTH-type transcriptional regulator [Chitinasiproducens palmae]SDV47096.1 transcriptional regulator, LysR family [Chitinasiproducens palmae]